MRPTPHKSFVRFLRYTLLAMLLPAAGKMYGQSINDTTLVSARAVPRLVAKQFSFTEGPAVDKRSNVFFTDQPNNKIWKWGTDGKLSVFLDSAGRANGLYFERKGTS